MEDRKLLLLKKEVTYGVDSVPTLAANAVLTRNFSAVPTVGDRINRNIDGQARGRIADGIGNLRQTLSYELELTGSGAPGTAPAWMEHLEACGMLPPVLTANVSAIQQFALMNTPLSSASVQHWRGLVAFKGVGARGTFSVDFTTGQYPFLKLDLTALLAPQPEQDLAPGVPTLTRWTPPVEFNATNSSVTLGNWSPPCRSISFDVSAEIVSRNLVNGKYIKRGNHAITGRAVIELPTIAQRNYFVELRSGALIGTIEVQHGIVAGNVVNCRLPNCQVTGIELTTTDGEVEATINFAANITTSNNDLTITAS